MMRYGLALLLLLGISLLSGCGPLPVARAALALPVQETVTPSPSPTETPTAPATATPTVTPMPGATVTPTPELIPRAFAPLMMKAAQFRYSLFLPTLSYRVTPSVPPIGFNPATTTVRLDLVLDGLREPTGVTNAGDGSGRLFALERTGALRLIRDGVLQARPFLDLTPLVKSEGPEQGVLGLAFHPDYERNGRFFVSYTDRRDHVIVTRYRVSADPDVADADSAVTLLDIAKPGREHNAGQLIFGPDGYLYISVGDGGIQGDPAGNAQRKDLLLGKILRIDVNQGSPYAIPPDNPFVGQSRTRPEIWAYGFRNPWRFSFDRLTGDLYIGDVGQDNYEEVDFQPAGSAGGQNYGWNSAEGNHCYPSSRACDLSAFVAPIVEYPHVGTCNAVIGGYVYRGQAQERLMAGAYFYADACTGQLWSLLRTSGGTWQSTSLIERSFVVSSFGEDEAGELYMTDIASGSLYRLVAVPR